MLTSSALLLNERARFMDSFCAASEVRMLERISVIAPRTFSSLASCSSLEASLLRSPAIAFSVSRICSGSERISITTSDSVTSAPAKSTRALSRRSPRSRSQLSEDALAASISDCAVSISVRQASILDLVTSMRAAAALARSRAMA